MSLVDPKVFIECFERELYHFRTGTDAPIIDQLTEKNRPKQDLTKLIPVGRLEHQKPTVLITIGATVGLSLIAILMIISKVRSSEIRVWKAKKS